MHERKIWDRYLVGILGSLCLFTLALATFIKTDRHIMPQGIVRTMILVSPLAALLPFMWAVVREVRRDRVAEQLENRICNTILLLFMRSKNYVCV